MKMKKNNRASQKNKNIILVEPAGAAANVFAKFMKLPLMGTLYLGKILEQAGYSVKIFNENILGRAIKDKELQGDVLCLSILTPSASRGYEIAKRFKRLNPTAKVIIGGVHATFNKDEAAKCADQVVIGEGEEVILDIIENYNTDKFIYADKIKNIDNIPSPDFDLLEKNEKLNIYPAITSRGCPFDCDFCSVTQMFGRQYRTSSVEKVISELKALANKNVFIYDDNFTANVKRSHELMDRLIAENLAINWSAQVRVDVARDQKLVSKMSRAGCGRVYVGFESVNPKTLENFNKRQSVADIERAIKTFHDNNIKVHGMFIFGSDEDDKNVFEPTLDFCNKYKIDTVQYMALTPLPGTYTYKKMIEEKRLLHRHWQYYDGMHVVFKPRKMTAYDLQKGIIDTYQNFYSYIMASKDALDASIDFFHGLFQKTASRIGNISINRAVFKLIGKSIVNKWMRLNRKYIKYLERFR